MKRILCGGLIATLLVGMVAWAAPWTEVAPLNVARYKHRAVVLDGKIYVIGGQGPDKKCAPVEVYDPVTNTWAVVGSTPVNCEGPHVAAIGGTIFVLAGRDLIAKVRTLDGYMGTPTAEGITWQKVPGQTTMGHGDAATGVIGTKIYLVSGEDDTLTNEGSDYVQVVDVFDTATLTWSTAASIAPYGREDFDAATVGSKIVAIAGQGGPDNTSLRWLSMYDAETNTWQHWEEGVPTPWEHPRAVTIGDHVYVLSGKEEGGFVNFRFDLATMTWADLTPPPEPVQQCALVALNGKIFMIGGVHFDGTILNRVFVYDPGEDAATAVRAQGLTPQQEAWLVQAQVAACQPAVEDWDAIYQAAKAEGKVVIYSLSSRIYTVVDAFKAAYPGIEVEAYDMTDVEQVEKLTREQGAGIYNVDVLFTAGITTLLKELLPQHFIWNYVPQTLVDGVHSATAIPEQFREPLLVHSLEAKVVFYNFESNPAGCPVDSLWDLTRPEWRGRIQMKDPLLTEENMNFLQTIVQHADAMAAAYEAEFGKPLVLSPGCANAGYEFIKRIAANGIVLTQSDGDASKAVGTAGQTNPPLTLSVSSSKIRDNAKGQKLAIGWDIKPVVGITKTNYLAIANLAPHPNAAKLLIRFMVGDADGKAGYVPFYVEGQWSPRTDMTPPLREVTLDTLHQKTWFLDPDWIYEHGLEVQDFWLSLH